jgi:hypothetical protein
MARERIADIGRPLIPGQIRLRCGFAGTVADIHGNIQAEFHRDEVRNFHGLIEAPACQPGAGQRHRNDQIRIGFVIQGVGQTGGKRSRSGKITAVLQPLDQDGGRKLVGERCDDTIK